MQTCTRTNRHATILLVEDEPFVREVTREILQSAGYRVLCASTAAEAAALYSELSTEVDLLLTDIILPDENGRVSAANMLRHNPDLKVLYVSGYPDQIGALQVSGEDCLPKPYSSDLLMQKVASMFGHPALPIQEPFLMPDVAGEWPA